MFFVFWCREFGFGVDRFICRFIDFVGCRVFFTRKSPENAAQPVRALLSRSLIVEHLIGKFLMRLEYQVPELNNNTIPV